MQLLLENCQVCHLRHFSQAVPDDFSTKFVEQQSDKALFGNPCRVILAEICVQIGPLERKDLADDGGQFISTEAKTASAKSMM